MKTYRITALWEYFRFITRDVKAATEKAAKKKFRKRVKGGVTGLRVDLVIPAIAVAGEAERRSVPQNRP